MSKLSLAKKAIKMFRNDMLSKAVQRHNVKGWLRSVDILGDKWLLAKNIERKGG